MGTEGEKAGGRERGDDPAGTSSAHHDEPAAATGGAPVASAGLVAEAPDSQPQIHKRSRGQDDALHGAEGRLPSEMRTRGDVKGAGSTARPVGGEGSRWAGSGGSGREGSREVSDDESDSSSELEGEDVRKALALLVKVSWPSCCWFQTCY